MPGHISRQKVPRKKQNHAFEQFAQVLERNQNQQRIEQLALQRVAQVLEENPLPQNPNTQPQNENQNQLDNELFRFLLERNHQEQNQNQHLNEGQRFINDLQQQMFDDILETLIRRNQNQNPANQRPQPQRPPPPQRPPSPPPPPFQPQDVPRLFKELLNSFNINEQWEKDRFENSYKWKRYNNHGPFRSIDDFWDLHKHYCDLNNYIYGYVPFAKLLKRGMINPIQLEEGDFTYGSAKMWIDTGNAIRDRERLEIAPLIVSFPPL